MSHLKLKNMKKMILILAISATAGMVSCEREHTCECKSTALDGSQTSTKTVINATKKRAVEKCDEGDANPTFGANTDCEIISI